MRAAATTILALVAILAAPATAADLVVAGSTDRAAMQPLLDAFRAVEPDWTVDYREMETVALYDALRLGQLDPQPDLVISSAADLQVRLVNDGFTQPHVSEATARLPDFARWRDEAFGFTLEPLVFVANPTLLPPPHQPRSHEALARLVASGGTDGPKVATYDVGQSGIGYLAASFDAIAMSDYWPFVERISGSGLLTACCTSIVLDMVADGRALVGYNVLGSYARARKAAGAAIEIVLPEDFIVAITRVAVIPAAARHPQAGARFLDFLLSDRAQALLGEEALLPVADGAAPAVANRPVRPIPLNATLLALTDPMRRRSFIRLWSSVTGIAP